MVPSACQDVPDHRGHPGLLERKECRARRGQLAQPVVMVPKVQLVFQDPLGLPEVLVRTVTRVKSGTQDTKGGRVTKENMVHLDLQVPLVPLANPVPLGQTVKLEQEVDKVTLDRREMKGHEASQDLLVQLACRECLDLQGRRVKLVTSVPWVHQVLQDQEAQRVHQEQTVPKVDLVESATQGPSERRVNLVNPVLQESKAFPVAGVQKVKEGREERLGNQAPLGHLEPKDPLETMDPKAILVRLGFPAILVLLVKSVHVVTMVPKVIEEKMESKGKLDLPALLVKWVHQVLLGRGVQLEHEVPRGERERKARREKPEQSDLTGRPEQLGPRVPEASKVPMVSAEFPEQWVNKEPLEFQDKSGHLAQWVPLVCLD